MFGCQSCCDGTRFLCTGCNLCCNCCGCGDNGSFTSNGDNSQQNIQTCCQPPPVMVTIPQVPACPNLPPPPASQSNTNGSSQAPFNCPCAVLYSYGVDPCCGTPKTPDISHPCPWPWYKRVYVPGCPVVPGYCGHIPGYRMHGAGRTFGDATRDTCCIMGQWGSCCPILPCRVFEQ